MNKQHVKLSDEDRQNLRELLSKGKLKVRVQKRATALQMYIPKRRPRLVERLDGTRQNIPLLDRIYTLLSLVPETEHPQ